MIQLIGGAYFVGVILAFFVNFISKGQDWEVALGKALAWPTRSGAIMFMAIKKEFKDATKE